MKEPGNEDAFTGLELVILIVVVLAAGVLLVVLFSGNGETTSPHGLIVRSVSMTSTGLRLVGGVTGFAATDGKTSDVLVRYREPDPGKRGSTELTTALFLSRIVSTTSGIDMDQVGVTWISSGVVE